MTYASLLLGWYFGWKAINPSRVDSNAIKFLLKCTLRSRLNCPTIGIFIRRWIRSINHRAISTKHEELRRETQLENAGKMRYKKKRKLLSIFWSSDLNQKLLRDWKIEVVISHSDKILQFERHLIFMRETFPPVSVL